MIALIYLGKKTTPFTFTCRKFPKEKVKIIDKEKPVWVNKEFGMWLLKINPLMFVKVDEKGSTGKKSLVVDDLGDDPADTESRPEELRCPHCFKTYSDKKWYDKHVKKCSGKTEA